MEISKLMRTEIENEVKKLKGEGALSDFAGWMESFGRRLEKKNWGCRNWGRQKTGFLKQQQKIELSKKPSGCLLQGSLT
jgi:hypothetical protein